MDWIQVSIFTTTQGIEPVSGRLLELGITGIEIEDETDFKDFLENNKDCWDYVDEELIRQKEGETCIKVYISEDDPDMLAAIKTSMIELSKYDEVKDHIKRSLAMQQLPSSLSPETFWEEFKAEWIYE